MKDAARPEIDKVTGVETTGHEWDGIKELNKPLPKWWLYTFYASILWAFGYWIVYPAWPTLNGYTPGIWGYSQRAAVANEVELGRLASGAFRTQLEKTELGAVRNDPDLLRFAIAAGNSAFQTNCAPCHGRGAQGGIGYPNLADDEWLWGGKVEDIYKTIQFGIRSELKETRTSQMPKFGIDNMLSPVQMNSAAEFVLSLTNRATKPELVAGGAEIFKSQCASCHGPSGKGNVEQGAPDLTDQIWLYGGTREAILESIRTGRGGQMPWWNGRLDPVALKALAVYVHSLGGGK